MQLKSIDKYIKEKVQGYKPEIEEDLWSRIEEKLPAARVPNARGSWLLTAAAIIAIAVLTPFTIKFYNLTGRTQEIALKKAEGGSKPGNKATIGNTGIASVSIVPAPINSPVLKNSHSSVPSKNYIKNPHGIHAALAIANTAENAGSGIQPVSEFNENVANKNLVATTMAKQKVINEMMSNIFPENAVIAENANTDLSNENDTRYPDLKSGHPIREQKWNNWQSIFYPFWKNPAYTGSEGRLSISGDVKTDNLSEPVSRYTYTNTGIEEFIPGIGLGIGLFRLSELSPFSLQNTYGLALSKTVLRMGSTSIKIGASGTSINNNIFLNQLSYSDQINPQYGFINRTSEKNIAGTTHAYGANAGIWVSNPHIMAGFDITNINQPKPGFGTDATPLPREYRGTFGYRFVVNSDFQFMPMVIMTRENKVNQANAMLTAVYKEKFMFSIAYQAIDPTTGWGNPYVYGSVTIAKKIGVFASYGTDIQLAQMGLNETFVHVGLKYQIIR